MNTRKTTALLAALATIPLVASAIAQQGGPPGPPPGGQGGFGGPGGFQGPRPPMMGGPGMGSRILMRPEVQKELKLSDEQIDKIRAIIGPMSGPGGPGRFDGPGGPPPGGFGGGGQGAPPRGGYGGGQQGGPPQGGFGGGQQGESGGGQGGPPPPRGLDRAQMQNHEQEIDRKLKEVLSESQFKRYKELALQEAGPAALSRKEIADKVGLSDEQNEKIRAILEQGRPRPPQEGGGPPDFEATRKRMDQARDENGKKIIAVLTLAQREKWESMLGKPFKFEHPRFGPGGPGGPSGPPPPGGGG